MTIIGTGDPPALINSPIICDTFLPNVYLNVGINLDSCLRKIWHLEVDFSVYSLL